MQFLVCLKPKPKPARYARAKSGKKRGFLKNSKYGSKGDLRACRTFITEYSNKAYLQPGMKHNIAANLVFGRDHIKM